MKLKRMLSAVLLCSIIANGSYTVFAAEDETKTALVQLDESKAVRNKDGSLTEVKFMHSSEYVNDTEDEADDVTEDNAETEDLEAADSVSEDLDGEINALADEAADDEIDFTNPDVHNLDALADTNFVEYTAVGKDVNGNDVPYTITVNYEYELGTETCGQIHTVSKTEACDMVIPDVINVSIDGVNTEVVIRSVQRSAFEKCKATSITLPDTVKEIGEYAFASCPNLKKVDIKSSTDRYYATYTDDSGKVMPGDVYVTLPTTDTGKPKYTLFTTQIDAYAFYDCPLLTDVTIAGYQKLGEYVFANCPSLTNVDLNFDNLYTISSSTGLATTTLIKTNAIGNYGFQNCTSLKTITLPEKLYSIGSTGFFENCSALTDVYVSSTVKSGLSLVDFNGCNVLAAFHVTGENADLDGKNEGDNAWNTVYMSKDGALYKLNSVAKIKEDDSTYRLNDNGEEAKFFHYGTLMVYPCAKTDTVYNAPDTLTAIDKNVFNGNNYIEELKIDTLVSKGNVTIGESAFAGCTNIKKISIDNNCTVGKSAFENCTSLRNIFHTNASGTLGDYAFRNCAIEDTELYGWSKIGQYAFAGNQFKELTVGPTIGTLGKGVFSSCTSLKTANLSNWGVGVSGTVTFGTNEFEYCTLLDTVSTPESLLELSSSTFLGCTALKNVTLGQEHSYICASAFKDCTSLEELKGNRYLVRVASGAFEGCTALKKVEFTRTVKNIENNAFLGCDKFTEICAPKDSYANTYAVENGKKFTEVQNDIIDSEFFIYDLLSLGKTYDETKYDSNYVYYDESSNKYSLLIVDSYRGGFDRITFKYASTPYIGSSFISNPMSSYASMKGYLKGVDLTGVKGIGQSSFASSTVLTTTVFDNTLLYVDASAFSGCKALASTDPWTMSDDRIGESGQLNEIKGNEVFVIPSSCKTLGNSAFYNNSSIVSISADLDKDAAEAAASIGTSTFANCTKLESITLGDNIATIDKKAFSGCSALKSIKLPAALTVVYENTFENCKSLSEVEFNERLEYINSNAFLNCTGLTVLTFNNNLFFEANGFKGCSNISMLVIPNSDNITTVRDPFPDVASCLVCCAKPDEGVESKVEPYALAKGYEIKNVDLVDGLNYALIKVYVTVPDGLSLKKADGTVLKTGDYVTRDEELILSAPKNADGTAPVFYINDNAVESTDEITANYKVKESDLELVFGLSYEKLNVIYGDADGSGTLDATDAAFILQKVLDTSFSVSNEDYLDVDDDGIITASDASNVLQKTLDSSYTMPIEMK